MRVAVVNVNTFKGSQRETAKRGMTVIRLKVMVACSWKSWTKESQSWPILIWKLTFSTSLFQNSERFSFPKVVKIEVTSNRSTYETNERCSKSGNGAAGAAAPLRRLLLPLKACFSLVPTSVPFGCVLQCYRRLTIPVFLSLLPFGHNSNRQ